MPGFILCNIAEEFNSAGYNAKTTLTGNAGIGGHYLLSATLTNIKANICFPSRKSKNGDQVTVFTDIGAFPADVVRTNLIRDIALLKMRQKSHWHFAQISTEEPNVGSSLFVIGTPLDMALSRTVTNCFG